jgi:plastocyanin
VPADGPVERKKGGGEPVGWPVTWQVHKKIQVELNLIEARRNLAMKPLGQVHGSRGGLEERRRTEQLGVQRRFAMDSKHGFGFQMLQRDGWAVACLWAFLTTGAEAATVQVHVRNFTFTPATVNIHPGDTVQWIWDDAGHSVTSGSSCAANGGFDTGIQNAGFTFTRTFTQPGPVPYFCTPHCASNNMVGTVNVAAANPKATSSGGKTSHKLLLGFNTMYGVDGPFVGDANPMRDVVGDELPWMVKKSAKGQLFADGRLTIKVRGLVFPDDPSVPGDKRGINDETDFRALVSCLSEDGDQVVTKNVVTQPFAATRSGNANIKAKLALPNPCVAPIVMVIAGSEDKWFAVTGFEQPE